MAQAAAWRLERRHGERPLPSQMSGGDLDGDLYFVVWDDSLVRAADVAPMCYAAESPKTVPGGVRVDDICGA